MIWRGSDLVRELALRCRWPGRLAALAERVRGKRPLFEGKAAYLVMGDRDLLDLGAYEGVTMIRAYDFVQLLDSVMGAA